MNLIDVLIIGLILLGALQGYRKGLITGIANLVGGILGFIIAAGTYKILSRWLINVTPLKGWLEPAVYRSVLPFVESQGASIQQNVIDKVLGFVPQEWSNLFSDNLAGVQVISPQTLENIAHAFAETISTNIINIISFIVIFLAIIVVMQLLAAIVLKPLGLFGGVVNSGGGLFFGALGVFVILSIIVGLLSPLLELMAQTTGKTMIQEAVMYSPLLDVFHVLEQFFAAQLTSGWFEQLIPQGSELLKEFELWQK